MRAGCTFLLINVRSILMSKWRIHRGAWTGEHVIKGEDCSVPGGSWPGVLDGYTRRFLSSFLSCRTFPGITTMSFLLVFVYVNGQITSGDKSIKFEGETIESFRASKGIALDALKRQVNDAVVKYGDTRRVSDIHFRCPVCWEHGRVQCDALKLQNNSDDDTMFAVHEQYARLEPIELCADLVRSPDQIISLLRKPRSVDEIIAMCIKPDSSTVTSLTQP